MWNSWRSNCPTMHCKPARLKLCSEYLADENVQLYKEFLDRVADSPLSGSMTWKSASKKVVELSEGTLPVLSQQLMLAAVETRAYSAAIETHRKLSLVSQAACLKQPGNENQTAWAVVSFSAHDGSSEPKCVAICSPEEMTAALSTATNNSTRFLSGSGQVVAREACTGMPFDHVLSTGAAGRAVENSATVTLYAVLGTPSFASWHKLLKSSSSGSSGVEYVFRHTLPRTGVWATSFLSGYGVGLDVKKMEYKAVDDRALAPGADSEPTSSPAAGADSHVEWLGDAFRFEDFVQLHSGDQVVADGASQEGEEDKSVYGVAATHYLASVAGASASNGTAGDALAALQRLSGNLPLALPALKRIQVPSQVLREARSNSRYLGGVNAVLINGRLVDATSPSFNLFALLRTLQQEAAMLATWQALPLPQHAVQALKALGGDGGATDTAEDTAPPAAAGAPGADVLRVDVRRGARGLITWLNNIEKDPQFRSWKRTVRALTQPAWGMPSVKRNLFTAVFVIDPASPTGLRALASLVYFAKSANPVRIGLVFTVPPTSPDYAHVAPPAPPTGASSLPLPKPDLGADASSLHLTLLLAQAQEEHGTTGVVMFLEQLSAAWQKAIMAAQGTSAGGALGDDSALDKLPPVTLDTARQAYATTVQAMTGAWSQSAALSEADAALVDESGELRAAVRKQAAYVAARGLPVPCTTVNGRVSRGLALQSAMSEAVGADLKVLQGLAQAGVLTDAKLRKTSALSVLLESGIALPSYSEALQGAERHTLPVASPQGQAWLDGLPWLAPSHTAAAAANGSAVLQADMGTAAGLRMAREALTLLAPPLDMDAAAGDDALAPADLRVAVLHVGSWSYSDPGAALAALTHCLSQAGDLPSSVVVNMLLAALDDAPDSNAVLAAAAVAGADGSGWGDAVAAQRCTDPQSAAFKAAQAAAGTAAAEALRLLHTSSGSTEGTPFAWMSVNARVFAAAAEGDIPLSIPSLGAALGVEMAHSGTAIAQIVQASQVDVSEGGSAPPPPSIATLKVAAASALAQYTADGKRQGMPEHFIKMNYTGFMSSPAPGAVHTGLEVVACLDPVSAAAQRAAPLLLMARDWLGADVRVYLAPNLVGGDGPVQSFYRFVAPGTQVLHSGHPHRLADRATFTHIPGDPMLLTMKVYPPEPWNVQALQAEQDMDNLKMGLPGMPETVHVKYELKNLLVAGQCEDLTHAKPPNGLQLQLRLPGSAEASAAETHTSATNDGSTALANTAASLGVFSDSLVMQNLGYFQLKANPGVWEVALAPGRAVQLYSIVESSQGGDGGLRRVGRRWYDDSEEAAAGADTLVRAQPVVVRDFTGRVAQLRVKKRPGMEGAKLLATLGDEGGAQIQQGEVTASGLWGSVRSMFGGGSVATANKNDTIHVFSLASGHLYERFLRIMMLSVTKRASRPVHFWLVENFLSPAFKDTIHYMAKRYGFDVSFVTYKWPNWLNGQSEKQRIIWGYKILFLDVLFPLDVKKIITVDADQVVRTDLAELWDMDLEGAPYGYTPFCDSRAETLGFQFWRSGYWKNHLGENPYHISALYVVDLVRFRQAAVGDTLRGIYDQLSRDKNSLSNLDQDLPNFAQQQVPIKSLPIQWLWCESWCSDDSKAQAKTIDLCNNPLHKEPKLDMARRVISGPLFPESWVQLDEEVHAVLKQATAGVPHSEQASSDAKASAAAAAQEWYSSHTVESPWERAARETAAKEQATAATPTPTPTPTPTLTPTPTPTHTPKAAAKQGGGRRGKAGKQATRNKRRKGSRKKKQ